jgi:transposase
MTGRSHRAVSRDEARRLLTTAAVPPCPFCRPDTFPRRWVVERPLAWIMRTHRRARDYERLIQHSESLITWAAIALMTGHITRSSSLPGPFPLP